MSKAFIIAGGLIFGLSVIASLAAIAVGGAQWLGLAPVLWPQLPPQSLVVGGIFLGVPIMAVGWAMIWFGGWARNHR